MLQGWELWTALDTSTSERFLVSVFHSDAQRAFEEIQASVTTANALVHTCLLRTTEVGRDSEQLVVAAATPAGLTPVGEPTLPPERAWEILEQILDALSYAHAAGVPHGSLGPYSIFTNRAGEVRLLNHGIFGCPAMPDYASPQSAPGRTPATADDVYALGALAFRWLTGHPWRPGASFPTHSPLSAATQTIVIAMLSEAPYERPRDLAEIRALLGNEMAPGGQLVPIVPNAPQPPAGTSPPPVAPIASQAQPRAQTLTTQARVVSLPVALGLFAILMVAVALVFVLPDSDNSPPPAIIVTQQKAATPELPEAVVPTLAPMELARIEQLKADANEAAKALLRAQVDLEDAAVQLWAGDKYAAITRESEAGDQAFRDGDSATALATYTRLTGEARALFESRHDVGRDNLALGKAALEAGDFIGALTHLTIANATNREDDETAQLLSRAENLEEVIELIVDGEKDELDNNLDAAHEKFTRAAALDPQWRAGPQSVTRINGKIAYRNFAAEMTRGFRAIDEASFDTARAAFDAASAILPDSTEPADGQAQVALAERKLEIDALRASATSHAEAERWKEAAEVYTAALQLDPSLVFASEGQAEAEERLALDDELVRLLADPLLLTNDDEFKAARSQLARAGRIAQPGSRLDAQTIELSTRLSLARIPIDIEVRSDNQTELTVATVGSLGRIASRELQLFPGTYTIVGKRRGYKDVSTRITLYPGAVPDPVFVSCTEKI